MKKIIWIICLLLPLALIAEGTLFVGLEGSSPVTYYSDMEDFPTMGWTGHFSHDVSGAAATPDGRIYICEGAFTTHLYQASLTQNPMQLCTIALDMSSLAYGRDTLWGYSNYGSPRGIYSIDTVTGEVELALDVGSFRFFALDYNPEDDLFYGYTEYGTSGLYSINIDTGEMIQLTGSIPATNGQGRGMAVGDNTVFLTATRGDDGIPYFAYDISQGAGGEWVEFENPYPEYHSTGGAAWIAAPDEDSNLTGMVISSDYGTGIPDCEVTLTGDETYTTETNEDGEFSLIDLPNYSVYELTIFKEGFDLYECTVSIDNEDIDLGEITLMETAYPVENVMATETIQYEQVTLTWEDPYSPDRVLEGYNIYRFLECFQSEMELWELMEEETFENVYVDNGWAELTENLWQYAVIAVYTNGIYSAPAFSEPIEKIVTGNAENSIFESSDIPSSVYPNPFNPASTIAYQLNADSNVKVNIYNAKGQRIATLVDEYQRAGEYKTEWNGQNESGETVSTGIYYYIIITETGFAKNRMLLMK